MGAKVDRLWRHYDPPRGTHTGGRGTRVLHGYSYLMTFMTFIFVNGVSVIKCTNFLLIGACVKIILCNMQQQNIEFLLVFAKTNFKELHLVGVLSIFFLKEDSCPFQAYSGQHQSCYGCRKSPVKGHRKEMYTVSVSSYRKSFLEPLHITSMSCHLPKVCLQLLLQNISR